MYVIVNSKIKLKNKLSVRLTMANQDELLRQSAKDIVYDVLGDYKKAIPWFTGIRADWTLGHLRINLITDEMTFRSENFSQSEFEDICYKISRKIKRNLVATYIINFAKFNNENGRLSVGNLIEAVAMIFNEKEPEEVKERKSEKTSSSHSLEKHSLYQLSLGLNYTPSINDVEPSSLMELLKEESLLCFSEDESLDAFNATDKIEIFNKELEDTDIQWTVIYEKHKYTILTDIYVMEIIEITQLLD